MAAEGGGRHRWRRLRTVRARTTIAATLVVGAALLLGGIALVAVLHRSLVSNIDQVAELHAANLAELVRESRIPSTIGADEDEVMQVLDGEGRVVAASANVRGRPPIASLRPASGSPRKRTVRDIPGVQGTFRLLAVRTSSPQGPMTVYVATSLSPADSTQVRVRTSLFVGAPLLLALVTLTTWLTVGRALRPVEAIRSRVADIPRHDLGRRVPVPGTEDEISRLAATMNEMLDRLQTAFEQQRRFVADASHELQTPLATARTDLEVSLAHPDATAWTDVAHDLLGANRRMERLVADLLFIARADDGTPLPPPAPVDLHEVVLGEAARVSGSSRVPIDTSGVAGCFVLGRRDDLARAVSNILDNAERHARSLVKVRLDAVDGVVTLAVEDDGPGVPPDDRRRIFERFTRLDEARGRGAGGTGLGLAIVKEIVERHHGTVVAEGDGGGARFVVTLPAD